MAACTVLYWPLPSAATVSVCVASGHTDTPLLPPLTEVEFVLTRLVAPPRAAPPAETTLEPPSLERPPFVALPLDEPPRPEVPPRAALLLDEPPRPEVPPVELLVTAPPRPEP